MANPEHLAILKQGVEVWNGWRLKNPNVVPDLALDTVEKTFTLEGAQLQWFNLERANLAFADLTKADLSDAFLGKATLRNTILVSANLSGARLPLTDFSGAHLQWANFRGAFFGHTTLANNNLEGTMVEGARHEAPSSIGIDTLIQSIRKVPLEFFKGAGVPSAVLEALLRAHEATNLTTPTVFISYSSLDQIVADMFYKSLRACAVVCWIAPEDLKIGSDLRPALDEAIRRQDKVLLILSENSIRSSWVKREVERALDEETRRQLEGRKDWTILFPIRVDDSIFDLDSGWATDVRRRHIGDFRNWRDSSSYLQAFQRLLRDLKAESNT
jgi:hypothetical protein